MFPKIGVPPKSSILIRFFHYKPPILGYPYFWKHPNVDLISASAGSCFGSNATCFFGSLSEIVSGGVSEVES